MIHSGIYGTMPATRDECHLCHIHDHNHPSTLLRTSTLRDSSPPPRPRRHSRAGSMDRDYHHHHRDHHHHHHHHDRERRHSRSGRVPSALARLSEHNSHSLPASRSNTLNLYPEQVSVLPDGGHRFIGGDRVSVRSLELTNPRHAADNRSHHSLQQTTTLQKPLPDPLGSSFMPLHSHGGSHLSLQQATVVPSSQDRAQDYYLQVNRLPFKEDTRKHRFNLQTVLLIGCYTLLFVMAIIIGLVLCHQNGWLGFGSPVSLTEVVEDGGARGIQGGSIRRPNFDKGRLTNQNSENEPSDTLQSLTEVSSKPIPVHNVVHLRKQDPSNSNSFPSGRPRSISGARDHLNENQPAQTIPGNRPVQRVPDLLVTDKAVVSSSEKQFRTTNDAVSNRNAATENESASIGSRNVNSGVTMPGDRVMNSLSVNGNIPSSSQTFPRMQSTVSANANLNAGSGNENTVVFNTQPKPQTENIFLPRGPVQTTHFTTNNLPVAGHIGPAQIANGFSTFVHPTQGQAASNVQGSGPVLSNQNIHNFPSNVQIVPSQNTPSVLPNGNKNMHNLPGPVQITPNQPTHNLPGGLPTSPSQIENARESIQTLPSQIANNFPANIGSLSGNGATQIIPQHSNIPNRNGAQPASNVGKTLVFTEQIQTRPETGNTVTKKQPLRIILNAGHLSTSHESNQPSGTVSFSGVNGQLNQNSPQGFVQAAAVINGHQQGSPIQAQVNPLTIQANNFPSRPSQSPSISLTGQSGTPPGSARGTTQFNSGHSTSGLSQANPSPESVKSSQVQPITNIRSPGVPNVHVQSVAQKPQLNANNNASPLNQDAKKTTDVRVPGELHSSVIPVSSHAQPSQPANVPSNAFRPQIVHSEFSTVPPFVSSGPVFGLHAQNDLHPNVKQAEAHQPIHRQRLPAPSTDLSANTKQTSAASSTQEQISREATQGISLNADSLANTNFNKVKKVQNSGVEVNDIHMEKMKILREILDAEGSGKLLQDLITLKNNKNSISELSEQLSKATTSHRPSQSAGEQHQESGLTVTPAHLQPRLQQEGSASKSTGQDTKQKVRPNRPQSGRQPQPSTPNTNIGAIESKEKKKNNIQVVRELLASLISSPEVQEILSTRNRQGKRAELNTNSPNQRADRDSAKGDEMRTLLLQALAKEIPAKESRKDLKINARKTPEEESPKPKNQEKANGEKTSQPRRTITKAQQLAHFSTGTPGRVVNRRIGNTGSQQGSREHQSVRPPIVRTSRGRRTRVDQTRASGLEQVTRRKAKSIRRTAEGESGREETPRGVVRHWRTTDQHGTMSHGTVRSDGSFAFTNCRPAQMCQSKSIP